MQTVIRILLFLPAAAFAATDSDFLTTLRDVHGDYRWDVERIISVDLNRDGQADRAALGIQKGQVALAVQMTGRDAPIFIEIPIDGSQQFAICPGAEPHITVEEQSAAPLDALGENPAGYEICPNCFEITIDDGECDPSQFYWDVLSNQLSWWRA
jgi:hypothetical protein